ncbi:MAG: hemolysin family protein [Phycisphaerae bacterium]|nr:hemolysin family protein [Phycisphaerae bacterium]
MLEVLSGYPFHLLAMALLLAASAFFSGSETALFFLSREQLRRFRGGRSPFRHLAARLMDDPRALLVTVLFGNMTVNVAFFVMSVMLSERIAGEFPERAGAWRVVIFVVAPLAVIVLGEVTPKSLAATMPARLAPLVSLPLTLMGWVVLPLRLVLGYGVIGPLQRLITGRRSLRRPVVTTEELRAIVEVSEREGAVSRDESEMLSEVLDLADLRVREVMTPRVEIVACDVRTPTPRLLKLFRESRHSKIVVYEGAIDEVRGVVYAKTAFLSPDQPLATLVRPVHYVPETKTAESLLKEFRAMRIQFALVVDEYGGTAGLVTLEDCLEEIVGEIEDETDRPSAEAVRRLGPAEYSLAGNLSIRSWADLFDQDRPDGAGRYSTVAGFVTSLLGRVPREGDAVTWRNLEFTVEEVRRRRVTRVRLRLQEGAEGEEPEAPDA